MVCWRKNFGTVVRDRNDMLRGAGLTRESNEKISLGFVDFMILVAFFDGVSIFSRD